MATEINVSLEEMGVLDSLRDRLARIEARYPVLERLALFLQARRARGFALPQGVVALLDELEVV